MHQKVLEFLAKEICKFHHISYSPLKNTAQIKENVYNLGTSRYYAAITRKL